MKSPFASRAREDFELYLKRHFDAPANPSKALSRFNEAFARALLNGGKRFRPLIGIFTADLFSQDRQLVYPFLSALEMVHCYSLAHDDLPCMDDDDFRRGAPSLHKAYDEATALLVGDALLTESFGLLGRAYREKPGLALALIELLSQSSGREGMVGGQVLDLFADHEEKKNDIEQIHHLKTGLLIRAAVLGSSQICGATQEQQTLLADFGQNLGLAFQLADDLLDADTAEPTSFVVIFGKSVTFDRLDQVTDHCLSMLQEFSTGSQGLQEMVSYNRNRVSKEDVIVQ